MEAGRPQGKDDRAMAWENRYRQLHLHDGPRSSSSTASGGSEETRPMGIHKLGTDFTSHRQHDVPEPDNQGGWRPLHCTYAAPYVRYENAEGRNDVERCSRSTGSFLDPDDPTVRAP